LKIEILRFSGTTRHVLSEHSFRGRDSGWLCVRTIPNPAHGLRTTS
jgi:hypothetical protein